MKTLKITFLAVSLLGLVGSVAAQDVILKKDNTTVLSKVLEINSTEIKYKKWSNQDGPTYSINRSEVTRINYQNGEVETFNNNVVATPSSQPAVTVPVDEPPTPSVANTPKQQEPQSPYSRRRVQFSLNGGVAFPLGNFGKIDENYFCAPFSLYGDDLETHCGAAKTGFILSMRLHIPIYKKDKDIVGIPLKFNFLFNGIKDEEKKDFRSYYLDAISTSSNEYYGVNAYSYSVSKYPNYMNFSIMPGIDYTHYFNKMFALYFEANMGLNFAHVSNLNISNAFGGTYVYYDPDNNINYYSEKTSTFDYKTRVNFAYEFGGGIFILNHLSIGVYYTGYTPFSVSSIHTYSGDSWDDVTEECSGPKLKVSSLSLQLGVHF